MTKNEIHASLLKISPEEAEGSPHCFFGLPPTDDNPIAFVITKANFLTPPPLPEVWPTARTEGVSKLAFSDPT